MSFDETHALRAYQIILHSVVFDALPKMLAKFAGPAAFVDVYEIVSSAAEEALEQLKQEFGLEGISPEKLDESLRMMAEVHNRVAEMVYKGRSARVNVETRDDEIVITCKGRVIEEIPDTMVAAVYLGIVGGFLRALGIRDLKPLRDPRHLHVVKSGWALWYEKTGQDECVIHVKRV